MTTGAKTPVSSAKPGKKKAIAATRKRSKTDIAISTELAPAVAIALLGQAHHAKGDAAAALEPLAAGAVEADGEGKLRVQLLFENGAVLPIEMSTDAAQALGKGIAKELQKG